MTLVTLTARRLKPGAYDAFREAWEPGSAKVGELGWKRIFHVRDVADRDVVISFGLFDGTVGHLREAQAEMGRGAQVDRIGPTVDQVLLDGTYEVVEELAL
ncbi:MAG: hypothetical protein ACYDHH_16965 [Solirubrobacteraceae bacterium]